MDSEMITAAILTAAYISVQRQALSGGVVDTSVKDKYVEYLAFVKAKNKDKANSGNGGKGKK
jgi:hypothetical protein